MQHPASPPLDGTPAAGLGKHPTKGTIMSDRTSHRRRARRRRTAEARAHVEAAYVQMCEQCHGHPASRQFGDLLVCSDCRVKFPVMQPWRIDPESGEAVDTRTGKPVTA